MLLQRSPLWSKLCTFKFLPEKGKSYFYLYDNSENSENTEKFLWNGKGFQNRKFSRNLIKYFVTQGLLIATSGIKTYILTIKQKKLKAEN